MTLLQKAATAAGSALARPESDRRLLRAQALLLLFCALYFTLTPFNSVDCWWHMRGAEYFWHHGSALLNDPIAIPGDGPDPGPLPQPGARHPVLAGFCRRLVPGTEPAARGRRSWLS